ncbi:hypothetical protein B0H17DRAFT_1210368 [Mycena rosella]|uniref:Uncharacterized protein n=1 Tax=Mycena rosella TaxID=1033263 RepID=A0AAD7CWX4_MYCRO|nr:hypothetical protein B0H17DRAFT_1210368 [Mycena rosella]
MPRVAQTAAHQHRGTGGMFAPVPGNDEAEPDHTGDNLWESDMESDTEGDTDYFEAWNVQPKPRTYNEREERRLEKHEKAAAKHYELKHQLAAIDASETPSAKSAPKPALAASVSLPTPHTIANMFANQKQARAPPPDDGIEENFPSPGAALKRLRTDPPPEPPMEDVSSSDELGDDEEEPEPEQVEEQALKR